MKTVQDYIRLNLIVKAVFITPVFLLISCSGSKNGTFNAKSTSTYIIQGKIENLDSGMVILMTYDTTRKTPFISLDSAPILRSYFQFKGSLSSPLICKLKINEKYVWPYSHYFVLDTGTTIVKLFKDSMANSVIIGHKSTEQYNAFNKNLHNLAMSLDSNFSLRDKGIISADSLNKLEKVFYDKKSELLLQQVQSNPGSIVSAFLVRNNLNYDIDISTLKKIYYLLTDKNNYFARSILNYLNALIAKSKTEIGSDAPHFKISDYKNREITNETFKGKYVLIDFWASWCEPCRKENPFLVNAYERFADKGLQMLSVSVDEDRQSWERAINRDNLSWIQACDLKSLDSNKIAQDFGVTHIPSNFLIDKRGKIIGKDLMGKDIEEQLSRFLKNEE